MFDLGHYRGDLQSREITRHSQLAAAGPDPIFQLKAEGCLPRLDRDLPPDLDDLVGGKTEEVADMDGVALHDGEEPLLPGGYSVAVLAGNHRLVTDVIGHVVE